MTACLAPFLGAVADKVGRRKPWIGCFIAMMVPAILLLWLAVPGQAGWGIVTLAVALAVAGTGFAFTEVFHNAMLPSVVPYTRLGTVSGWGLALGNGGALIILVGMLYAFALPASGLLDWGWLPEKVMFGMDTAMFEHDRIAAPITAVWLVIFALPLFFFTPDQSNTGVTASQAVKAGIRDVWRTIQRLKAYRNIATYLLARMFFNDGKVAIMTFYMIYATGIFDWGGAERLLVGVFLTVFAIAAGFIGGWLDDIVGSKKAIVFTITGNFIASWPPCRSRRPPSSSSSSKACPNPFGASRSSKRCRRSPTYACPYCSRCSSRRPTPTAARCSPASRRRTR